MKLWDLFDRKDYYAALDAKLISTRFDGQGLVIHNYTDAAMYTPGAWDNPAVRACRGLITTYETSSQDDVVARPWAKFFNHGQAEAGELDLDAPVQVTDKLDGSLGIIHRALDGSLRVATRGSFESEQAIHATRILRRLYPYVVNVEEVTPLVEIIYPANRIVVDYGAYDNLALLGGVEVETGDYLGPEDTARYVRWHGPKTEVFDYVSLRQALAAAPRPGKEGMCVRYLDQNHIVKIKQEDYVRLHRIVTGLSERTVWQHMMEDKPIEELLNGLPDELHDWVWDVWTQLVDRLFEIIQEARTIFKQIFREIPTGAMRRDFAEEAKKYGRLTPLLFQLYDGRDIRLSILKGLKPAGDTRAKTLSEATA